MKEKKEELWLSPMTKAPTSTEKSRKEKKSKTPPKTSMTQRVRTDLGRSKGRALTQSYDKSPYIHRKIQKGKTQHKNATKNFDDTTSADRLRTVSSGNDSHPTGVVKPVNGILVQRIIVKKWLDRSLFDKGMKFGIVVVYSITKDISYDAKQNRSKIWYFGVKQQNFVQKLREIGKSW